MCVLEWRCCSRTVCAIPLRQTGSGTETWLKSQVSLVVFQFSLHSASLPLPYHLRWRQIPHFRGAHFCAWKLAAFPNLWFHCWQPQGTQNSGYFDPLHNLTHFSFSCIFMLAEIKRMKYVCWRKNSSISNTYSFKNLSLALSLCVYVCVCMCVWICVCMCVCSFS